MALARTAPMVQENSLSQLLLEAQSRKAPQVEYAGEVTPQEVYAYLSAHEAVLIDVRTPSEWQAGRPDLSQAQGKLLLLSWKTYPDYAVNPTFVQELSAENSVGKDTPLFFLCRSGGRSLDAAVAMTAAGYRYCFNVTGGFEGARVPGTGWKAAQLPYKQG